MKPRLLDLGVLVDDEDVERIAALTVYIGTNGYAYFSIWSNGASRPDTLHSFIMGGARKGFHIDHINGDKLDNRKENLRFTSPSRNQVNRHKLNKNSGSGVRGVTKRSSGPNPFIAQIMVNRRMKYLGSFPTLESARIARKSAELSLYGEVCP